MCIIENDSSCKNPVVTADILDLGILQIKVNLIKDECSWISLSRY